MSVRTALARSVPAAAATILLLLLAGCGTLSREQCQAGDWYQIGLADGRAGKSPAILGEHQKACGRYSLPVDPQAWRTGWEEGLVSYCTPVSGFSAGVKGDSYENVCSGRSGAEFLTAYSLGSDVYRARRQAREAAEEARRLAWREERIEDEIRELRSRLDDASDSEKSDIRARIADLRGDRMDLVGDRMSVRMDAIAADREADQVEAAARLAFARTFGYPAP